MRGLEKLDAARRWLGYFLFTLWRFILVPSVRQVVFKATWEELWEDVRAWGWGGMQAFGIRVEILNPDGVDLDRQYILAANHRSWFDQLAVAASHPRPTHYLAHEKYCSMPLFGHGMVTLGQSIPVAGKRLSPESQAKLAEYLERGDTVLFFVEGTRGVGKELLPFSPGAFRYAAQYGVPVLPLYLFGSEEILSKQRSLLTVRPGTLTILIGKPWEFTPEGLDAQMAAFEAAYRKRHDALYDGYHERALASAR